MTSKVLSKSNISRKGPSILIKSWQISGFLNILKNVQAHPSCVPTRNLDIPEDLVTVSIGPHPKATTHCFLHFKCVLTENSDEYLKN